MSNATVPSLTAGQTPRPTTGSTPRPTTGKTVFWWITGFFAVIIGVNLTMAVLALTTFNGVTNDSAYVDGLAYNKALSAIQDQKALGWNVDTEIGRPGDSVVSLSTAYQDKSGAALNRLDVIAEFIRPVHQGYDFSVPLQHTGDGVYTAKTAVPLTGQWQIRLVATQANAAPYILSYRTQVR